MVIKAENFMKLLQGVLLLTLVACGAVVYQQSLTHASQQEATAAKPTPSPATSAGVNPNQEINNRFVKQFSERIAGRENEPAEKVRVSRIYNGSRPHRQDDFYGLWMVATAARLEWLARTAHVEQDFASDDKRPKRAAREIMVMHRMINDQLVKMQNIELKPEQRFISCSTCHRGAINPLAAQ